MAEYCPICGNKITGFIKPNLNKLWIRHEQKRVALSLPVCNTCFEMLALQNEDRRERLSGGDLLAAFVSDDDIEKSISYFSEKLPQMEDKGLQKELADIVYGLKNSRNFWRRITTAETEYIKKLEEYWDQFHVTHNITSQSKAVIYSSCGLLKCWIGRDDTHFYICYPTKDSAETTVRNIRYNETLLFETETAIRNNDIVSTQKIPVKNILYFQSKGTKQYISEIHGGGVNTGGALAGGMLFGVVGAIVGSHLGTELQSETKEIDERSALLKYTDENGNTLVIPFDVDSYDAFMEVIPEKEYDQVTLPKDERTREQTTPVLTTSDSISAADEILKFKNLLDIGAITQEEFDTKKKQLLGL